MLLTRKAKGELLTHNELDNNLLFLQSGIVNVQSNLDAGVIEAKDYADIVSATSLTSSKAYTDAAIAMLPITILPDGSVDMDAGYTPLNALSVATKEYVDSEIVLAKDLDTTNFNGVLSSADTTIQLAFDTIDNLQIAAGGVDISLDTTNFNGRLSASDTDVQTAMETIDNLTSSGTTIADGEVAYQEWGLTNLTNSPTGAGDTIATDTFINGVGVGLINAFSTIGAVRLFIYDDLGNEEYYPVNALPSGNGYWYQTNIVKNPNLDRYWISDNRLYLPIPAQVCYRTKADPTWTTVINNLRNGVSGLSSHGRVYMPDERYLLHFSQVGGTVDTIYIDILDTQNIGAGFTELVSYTGMTSTELQDTSICKASETGRDFYMIYKNASNNIAIIYIDLDNMINNAQYTTAIPTYTWPVFTFNRTLDKIVCLYNPTSADANARIGIINPDGTNFQEITILSSMLKLRQRAMLVNSGSNVIAAGGYYQNTSVHKVGLVGTPAEIIKSKIRNTQSHILGLTNAISLSEVGDSPANTSGAYGTNSLTQGIGTNTPNDNQVALGSYNIGTDANTVLEIGIGTGDASRANALEIFNDGTATLPDATIAEIDARGDKAVVTKEYMNANAKGVYVIQSLPAADLTWFEKAVYVIDTVTEYICVANTLTPTDADCFWLAR